MVQKEFNINFKQIKSPLCDLKQKPKVNSNLETQLLFGEKIEVLLELDSNWIFCRSCEDNYKGYIKKKDVGDIQQNNFRVCNLSTHIYKKPNIKSKVIVKLFFNSKVFILNYGKQWSTILIRGKKAYVYSKDIKSINYTHNNSCYWVNIALKFLNTSYLWGGKSCLGIDCSALIQLALAGINISFPRNTIDQIDSKLLSLVPESKIDKGVLIFWRGHVALAISQTDIIHANAYHMRVERESFKNAKKRIENSYGKIIKINKLNIET